MPALVAVIGRPAPVLLEERPQPPLGSLERTRWVHRAKYVVAGDPQIEGIDQRVEEIGTAEEFVWCLLGGFGLVHPTIVSDPGCGSAGASVATAEASIFRWLSSARSTMWRAIGGKTNAWKGATDHQ